MECPRKQELLYEVKTSLAGIKDIEQNLEVMSKQDIFRYLKGIENHLDEVQEYLLNDCTIRKKRHEKI
jgi:hypothetical protein